MAQGRGWPKAGYLPLHDRSISHGHDRARKVCGFPGSTRRLCIWNDEANKQKPRSMYRPKRLYETEGKHKCVISSLRSVTIPPSMCTYPVENA